MSVNKKKARTETVSVKPEASRASVEETKTFADLRRLVLALVPKENFRDERILAALVVWSHEAEDDELLTWVGHLPAAEGWQSHAAGLLAVARFLDGNEPAAKRLLAHAEATLPPAESPWHTFAHRGLVPAWWRLAPGKAADALPRVRESLTKGSASDADTQLYVMAALGGQKDLVDELVSSLSFRRSTPLLALAPLTSDGAEEQLAALLEAWSDASGGGELDVSRELVRELLRRGKPERYVELVLAQPVLLDDSTHLRIALAAVERTNPSLAASLAHRLLGIDDPSDWRSFLVRTFSRHAPAEAAAWAAEQELSTTDRVSLGREEEVREALTKMEAKISANDGGTTSAVVSIAETMNDRALAVRAIKACCDGAAAWDVGYWLLRLIALEERSYVDAHLERGLEELSAVPSKKRDQACRDFAKAAGGAGRIDLVVKAIKLAPSDTRSYVALTGMEGCAQAGDWTGAVAAFAEAQRLQPDGDHYNDVMTSGIDVAMRASVDESSAKWG